MTVSAERLLIVDDDTSVAALVAEVARDIGCESRVVSNWKDFREAYTTFRPTLIALDLVMPDVDGVEILRFLSAESSKAKILLVSGSDGRTLESIRRLSHTMNLRTVGTLQKPMSVHALQSLLQKALGLRVPIAEGELKTAIEAGHVVPFFQPIVRLNGDHGAIGGMEVLARWSHPQYGCLMPEDFIPVAERVGLIHRLTISMVEAAAGYIRSWRACGFDVPLSVNLSVRCLRELSLPDRFSSCFGADPIAASMITFEVTENLRMTEAADPSEVLTRLRLKGFGLSMDDFGTGYSTLVQLARLPFNELKIDRAFVAEIGEHRESEIIIESTVALAHSMGMTVCAEGVESAQALDFVSGAGCDTAQGFLISRPMPADRVLPFLRSWAPGRLSAM